MLNRALLLGSLAALFFSSTFVVNRILTLDGASALWLAGLRYTFTVPMLAGVLAFRRELGPVCREVAAHPWPWLLWGTVGFGLFYLPLTWASHWAPAWLVAGGWQITIVLGSFTVPFVDRAPVPWKDMWPSLFIVAGIGLAEWSNHQHAGWGGLVALVPIIVAGISYPLGNRQMMRYTRSKLPSYTVYQRTFGMTLGSMPFWIAAMAGGAVSAWPTASALLGTLAVAVFSGMAATLLFFRATEHAQGDPGWLARIEATQSLEIFFTVLIASLIFSQRWPTVAQWIGLAVIMGGMTLHSLWRKSPPSPELDQATSSG